MHNPVQKRSWPYLAALVCIAFMVASQSARADVCVWRDPERTMSKLFPAAGDYKTVTKKITAETARIISERAGVRLDDSERSEFNYYEITGRVDGKVHRLGTVLALAGTGEYGAIEVVAGLDNDNRIVGVYIQRIRERNGDKLRSEDFLGQFRGKSIADPLDLGKDIKPVSEAMTASRAISNAVKKMLVFYDVLR